MKTMKNNSKPVAMICFSKLKARMATPKNISNINDLNK